MEQVEEKLMTPKKFSIAIEKAVKESGGTHMDALLAVSYTHLTLPTSDLV